MPLRNSFGLTIASPRHDSSGPSWGRPPPAGGCCGSSRAATALPLDQRVAPRDRLGVSSAHFRRMPASVPARVLGLDGLGRDPPSPPRDATLAAPALRGSQRLPADPLQSSCRCETHSGLPSHLHGMTRVDHLYFLSILAR